MLFLFVEIDLAALSNPEVFTVPEEISRSSPSSSQRRMSLLPILPATTSALAQIEATLIAASPLLEALGNATTRMNHNSSRFGRLTRVYFGPLTGSSSALAMTGATIENFLLEKPRLTARIRNERTFHIFYQLLSSPEMCAKFALAPRPDIHHYTSGGKLFVATIDDVANFKELQESCHQFFPSTESGETNSLSSLLEIVAAILHLGNLEIEEDEDDQATLALAAPNAASDGNDEDGNELHVDAVVRLLKLSNEHQGATEARRLLANAITFRSVTIAGEEIMTPLTDLQAAASRDAITKAIYGWLFDYAVRRVNNSIAKLHKKQESPSLSPSTVDRCIAILDIYGFEVMEQNSLEQLLINLANENLQQIFNERVLLHEKVIFFFLLYQVHHGKNINISVAHTIGAGYIRKRGH